MSEEYSSYKLGKFSKIYVDGVNWMEKQENLPYQLKDIEEDFLELSNNWTKSNIGDIVKNNK
jgi:hypothetical protein